MTSESDLGYSQELRCQELIELVTDYLEATMLPVDQLRFEQHLARCDACASYLSEIRKTIKASATLGQEWITPTAKAQLLAAFRTWKDGFRAQPKGDRHGRSKIMM